MPCDANGLKVALKALLNVVPLFLIVLLVFSFLGPWGLQRIAVLACAACLVSLGKGQSGYLVKKRLCISSLERGLYDETR